MFNFGKRSILSIGASGGITLPSVWVQNVKPDGVVYVFMDENYNLVISPNPLAPPEGTYSLKPQDKNWPDL